MRSRWVIVSALLVMCTLALAGAATVAATSSSSAAPAAPAAAQADPYAAATTLTSTPLVERRPCTIYASDCLFEGGPCGPVANVCHCLLGPDGWICAGRGSGR